MTTCNKEGWVPIETILTFKRMREFQPYGVQFVVEALKKVVESEGNDPLVAVDAEAGNVRRKRPLEAQTDAWSRSVYVVRVSLTTVCSCANLGRKVSVPERRKRTARSS